MKEILASTDPDALSHLRWLTTANIELGLSDYIRIEGGKTPHKFQELVFFNLNS